MDQNQETSLFGFGIDQTSRSHLSEAVKWARFLAIVGFVVCGLITLVGIFVPSIMANLSRPYDYEGGSDITGGLKVFMALLYIGIAVVMFFPYYFLLKFANLMKTALNTDDQLTLNSSFQNLKIMFRYVGILTIIMICIYGLAFLVVIMAAVNG